MNNPDLPKWILQAYTLLYNTVNERKFTIKDAEQILSGTDIRTIRIILSRLNKSGFLFSEPSSDDSRLRIYSLLPISSDDSPDGSLSSPVRAIPGMPGPASPLASSPGRPKEKRRSKIPAPPEALMEKKSDEKCPEKEPFNNYFSIVGDAIRGADDLLICTGILWLKHVRDSSPVTRSVSFADLLNPESDGYRDLQGMVNTGIESLAQSSLSNFSLSSFSFQINKWLEKLGQFGRKSLEPVLASFFNGPPIHISDPGYNPFVTGVHLYSLLNTITRGIKGFEPIPDPNLANLMVSIASPRPGEQIYNPCTGYGELVLFTHFFLGKNHPDTSIFSEPYTSAISKKSGPPPDIASFLSDIFNVPGIIRKSGDILRHPAFWDQTGSGRFDLVLSVIPAGIKGYTEELLKEDDSWTRYRYGFPSRRNAEWLFIQHMVASMSDNGRAVLLIPSESLVRRGADAEIRLAFMKKAPVEGVILLPGETGIPSDTQALLILNKNRKELNNTIFCMDATKKPVQIQSSSEKDGSTCSWILSEWKKQEETPGISRLIPLSDIIENGGDINIPFLIHGVAAIDNPDNNRWRWVTLTPNNHRVMQGFSFPPDHEGTMPVLTPGDIDERGYFALQNLYKSLTPPDGRHVIPPGSVIFSVSINDSKSGKNPDIISEWSIDNVTLIGMHVRTLLAGEGIFWIEITDPSLLSEYLGLLLHLMQQRVWFRGTPENFVRTGLEIRIPVPPVDVQAQLVKAIWKDETLRIFLEQMIRIKDNH